MCSCTIWKWQKKHRRQKLASILPSPHIHSVPAALPWATFTASHSQPVGEMCNIIQTEIGVIIWLWWVFCAGTPEIKCICSLVLHNKPPQNSGSLHRSHSSLLTLMWARLGLAEWLCFSLQVCGWTEAALACVCSFILGPGRRGRGHLEGNSSWQWQKCKSANGNIGLFVPRHNWQVVTSTHMLWTKTGHVAKSKLKEGSTTLCPWRQHGKGVDAGMSKEPVYHMNLSVFLDKSNDNDNEMMIIIAAIFYYEFTVAQALPSSKLPLSLSLSFSKSINF